MRILTVNLPEEYYTIMDELEKGGIYNSGSEIVRQAIRNFINKTITKDDKPMVLPKANINMEEEENTQKSSRPVHMRQNAVVIDVSSIIQKISAHEI